MRVEEGPSVYLPDAKIDKEVDMRLVKSSAFGRLYKCKWYNRHQKNIIVCSAIVLAISLRGMGEILSTYDSSNGSTSVSSAPSSTSTEVTSSTILKSLKRSCYWSPSYAGQDTYPGLGLIAFRGSPKKRFKDRLKNPLVPDTLTIADGSL